MFIITLRGGETIQMTDDQYLTFRSEYERVKTSFGLVCLTGGRETQKANIVSIDPIVEEKRQIGNDAIIMGYGTFKNGIGIKHPFSDGRLLLNEEKELDTAKDLANKHKKNEVMLLFDNYDILSDKVQKFLVTPTSIVEHGNEIGDDFRKNWKTSPDYIGEYGLKGAKKLITK